MLVKIAARQSDLARLQAYEVGQALQNASPGLKIEYSFRSSLGDQRADDPLWKMPEKGVFTEDFVADILSGRVDLVVHSWKDLPVVDRAGTQIAATLPRADVRDVLLVRRDVWERRMRSGPSTEFRVLTSSPRRVYNLGPFLEWALPWLEQPPIGFYPVRGNIATRVKKLVSVPLNQSFDALVVAKAALDRLLTSSRFAPELAESEKELRAAMQLVKFVVIPLNVNPTAAAQGALAIEVRSDRRDLLDLCAKIDARADRLCVEAERKELARHGGGCHQKIGVTILDRSYGRLEFIRGLTDAGLVLNRVRLASSGSSWPRARSHDEISPNTMKSTNRKSLDRPLPEGACAIYVARANAWPAGAVQNPTSLVWTAGMQTWRQLAKRGVWVNGTSESLGEIEEPRVETLQGAADGTLRWIRLTHDQTSHGTPARMETFATYHIDIEPPRREELVKAKYFFWKSGSQFLAALAECAEIADGFHGSGPGQTHQAIVAALAGRGITGDVLKNRVRIFLNEDDFLNNVTPESTT